MVDKHYLEIMLTSDIFDGYVFVNGVYDACREINNENFCGNAFAVSLVATSIGFDYGLFGLGCKHQQVHLKQLLLGLLKVQYMIYKWY